MKYLLFIALILVTSPLYAISGEDVLHITAHFGGVYAVTHVTEVACTKLVGKKHKTACTVAGVVVGNGLNVAYKANENFPHDTSRAVLSGAAGSIFAATIITLDW